MDRNTLTALLLITVVLVLTPYYMDLISPPQESTRELFEEDALKGNDVDQVIQNPVAPLKSLALPQARARGVFTQ